MILSYQTATGLVTNSKGQENYFTGICDNLTKEQKLFYNRQYFETLIQRFYYPYERAVADLLPADFSPVVNSVTHALLSTKPKVEYIPGRGGGILVALGTIFPYFLSNRILLNLLEFNKAKGLQPSVEDVYGTK